MKPTFLVIIGLLLSTKVQGQTDSVVLQSDTAAAADTGKTFIVEINKLLYTAQANLGSPYRYAGKKPGGFDCSGFVMYCYSKALGIQLSPAATVYYQHGKQVSKEEARPGDVICFTGSNAKYRSIGHVAIITEVTPTDIYFIHSALNGGVRYDSLSLGYYKLRFLQIRRILY